MSKQYERLHTMKKLLLATALLGTLGMATNAVLADDHKMGDHSKKMMERVDTNSDGMVSKAEFMAKHEEKFAMMDKNSDGMLSKDEMMEAKKEMKSKWKDRKSEMKDKMSAE